MKTMGKLGLTVDLCLFALFLFSMHDTEVSPWLGLQTLMADFLAAIFAVTVSAFVDPLKSEVDPAEFEEFAITD